MFWGGSRSTKPCVFPCKVAAGDDERYLVCAAVAAGVGLTDGGVHAAAMLLSAYRAGAECRLSQADAAWVRNVIADSENFLPDLLREVP